MYTTFTFFIVYIFCLDGFLGDWMKALYANVANGFYYLGMNGLAVDVEVFGFQSLHGTGYFISAAVLAVLTSMLLGERTISEIEPNGI